jgi:hypothetical protein
MIPATESELSLRALRAVGGQERLVVLFGHIDAKHAPTLRVGR